MVTEIQCLVDKHRGSEPYFRIEGGKRPSTNSRTGPETHDPKRVVDDLHQRTHNSPSPVGDLNRVYPHAIEIGRIELNRVIWVGMTLFGLGFAAFCAFLLQNAVTSDMPFAARLIMVAFMGFFIVILLLFAWWGYRITMWGPRDAPVLFNRKTRQIHAVIPVAPHMWKVWQLGRSSRVTSCPWDRVKVRSYVYLAGGGGGATTKSALYLLWDTPDAPKKLVDYVRLGSEGGWIDDTLYRQWEYVRRYMEEDGPVLPTDHGLGPDYNKRPNMFPPAIVEAAGGQPYTPEEIEELVREYKTAEEATEGQAQESA